VRANRHWRIYVLVTGSYAKSRIRVQGPGQTPAAYYLWPGKNFPRRAYKLGT
jgi:hypothetical protein